jgi:hypothetical protein
MDIKTHQLKLKYNNMDTVKSIVFDKNDLNILYINIVSLRKNLSDLQLLISSLPVLPDIILLTETRLYKNETKYHNLAGYTGTFVCRQRYVKKSGGGVCIYVKDNLKFNVVKTISNSHDSLLLIHIPVFKCNFAVIYSPPDSNKRNFLAELNNVLLPSDTLLFGDFNIDMLEMDKKPIVKEYLYTLVSSGFNIINKTSIQYPTRTTVTSQKIIDHVLTNKSEVNGNLNLIHDPISDHKLITLSLKLQNKSKLTGTKETEPVKIVNYEAISNYIDKHPIVLSDPDNPNTNILFNELSDKLQNIIAKFTSLKKVKPEMYLKPWMTAELLDLIHTRNLIHKSHKINPENVDIKERFTNINTKTNNLKRSLKKKYFSKADCTQINAKFCWKLLNEIVYNKTGKKMSNIPHKIVNPTDNHTVTTEIDILNEMNKYFCNVGNDMNNKVKNTHSTDPKTIPVTVDNGPMPFPTTDEDEILKIIKKLKVNSAPGHDHIQTKLVKKCSTLLIKPLTQIANSMLQHGCFPDTLKIAKVTPIFKEGDKYQCSNYRPISVLSVFSKILESLMLNRILQYLASQKIISDKQFGFCDKSSTQAAIINLLNTLQKEIDAKAKTLGALLFIDLSKAFDSISKPLLIEKCELLGIRGPALKLITSYLNNRYQYTANMNTKSENLINDFGVPQGGLSSPTFFNIFINDIVNLPLRGNIALYADDICISYSNTSEHTLMKDMQNDLNIITNWLNFNELTMNAKKTKFMILSPSQPPKTHNPPTIATIPIEQVKTFKYLGLIIDEQLKWKHHIEHVINKIAPITGILWRTRHSTTLAMRRKIYFALIHSHLNYLAAIWGNTYKSHLKPLKVMQNKALKIVYNYEWRKTHTGALCPHKNFKFEEYK